MKYYLITYSAEIRPSGNRVYWSKAITEDPVDYFIEVKEESERTQIMPEYTGFTINFITEITEKQYLKLNK